MTSAVKDTKSEITKKTGVKAPKVKVSVKEGEVSRLRIRVRAYEHKILDASLKQIMDTAIRYDVKFYGPVPLPTEIKKYTVNRSAFILRMRVSNSKCESISDLLTF